MNGYDIQGMWNALKAVQGKKLPVKISFAIARNITIMSPIVRDIDEQQRKIIERYFVLGDDGKPVIAEDGGVKITNPESLEEEIEELMAEDVRIEFRKVSEELFEKCDEGKYDALTPSEIANLNPMIEEKEAAVEQHIEHKL